MFKRIVVGLAKADSAKRAANAAIDLAQRYDGEVHLVMAFERTGAGAAADRKGAEAFLTSYQATVPVPSHLHALPDSPADAVLMVAEEVGADLIVVGNRGMKGARRVLGSVPNTIAHQASCSVLIVDSVD
jgi:nucleotide-binding universal stress UspA family protein